MRSRIPAVMASVDLGQNGFLMTNIVTGSTLVGDAGGYDGVQVSQPYIEFIFGKECGLYTSADNTSGTRYLPDIECAVGFRHQSQFSTSSAYISAGIQCKSWHIEPRNNFEFSANYDNLSRLGTYDPSDQSNYLFLDYSEEYFGKFSRVAVGKGAAITHVVKFIITKGEGL